MLTLLIEFFTACDDGSDGVPADDGSDGVPADDRSDGVPADDQSSGPADDQSSGPPADQSSGPTDDGTGETRPAVSVDEDDGRVLLSVGDHRRALTPAEATRLRTALGEAVADRWEFLNTVGERQPDGSYVVHRRGSEATGNSVAFDGFDALCRLAERLPATVDAGTVGHEREGVTGSRRHLVVWHLAEHPAFDYRVDSRSPLRVRLESESGEGDENRAGTVTHRTDGRDGGETATGDD